MSDISARYWVPGMAIAVLATLYTVYKMMPVQTSAYASQAAPVADTKLERLHRAKAQLVRAVDEMNACYAKYSDVDCLQSYAKMLGQVYVVDCAYCNYARGNSELEKLQRRWQQDVEEIIHSPIGPMFNGGDTCKGHELAPG